MYINPKIIVDFEKNNKENFFCKICEFPLLTAIDFDKNSNYGCCENCYLTFVEARKTEWLDGWRPDKTTFEEYIYNRTRAAETNS